ncbi:LPXTG cell wall anchor domain-containing protein [Schleiferilactobacillus perolens]|uniref:Gram-positive cocci surface proteins LPxTG domain-containing protein n=1 Tax=Schleiferilactobacillus perolens DSM 12744 TaxID=1423792 RepID=A0A0R1NED4_9LACO|nr:LPXTG cell wall anchor domain-containing protein [Schleiferilactobacillus perolens]KRL14648.1 hypothetical protein FD09_GL000302 [Schleiferilactobacillus perolens DSM 12744]
MPNATATDVATALTNLTKAQAALQKVPDKTALAATVKKAQAIDLKKYETAGQAAFQTKLQSAQKMLADGALTQADQGHVDALNKDLTQAMAALKPLSSSSSSSSSSSASSASSSQSGAGSASTSSTKTDSGAAASSRGTTSGTTTGASSSSAKPKTGTLPQTGEAVSHDAMLIGGLMILFGLTVYDIMRRKKLPKH